MKNNFSNKGFSLIELVVASVLVVIVILGIFAINSVLNNNNQDYGQRYFVRSETQTTLNHILNNASLAIGSGTTINGQLDIGILSGTSILGNSQGPSGFLSNADHYNFYSFCIHQDIPPGPYVNPTTIDNAAANAISSSAPNYTNSRWLCYTSFPGISSVIFPPPAPWTAGEIIYCTMPYNANAPYRGADNCLNGPVTAGPVYLGSIYRITNPIRPNSYVPNFNISQNVTISNPVPVTFYIIIRNCLDNSYYLPGSNTRGTCDYQNNGTSSDPVNNPEIQLTGSVVPSQQGMLQN